MKSPFPGMDPYIEECGVWADFHDALIHEIRRGLARAVPERYLVRTAERSYLVLVESEGKNSRPFVPDVSIVTAPGRKKPSRKGGTAVAEPAGAVGPVTMRAFIDERHRETFVEVYETDPEQRLVTTVEVLSPSNKQPGTPGWDLYQRKRQSLLLGDVNLVEIDLLRGGRRMPMLDPWPDSPYVLLVAKAGKPQLCQAWPVHFRWPLPPLPVPLAKPDDPVMLSLQPLIDVLYEESRYDRNIDYTRPLTPPLAAEETGWLKKQLRARAGTGP
jgi:hypothetical protein